jgi:FolB domain-containing protein
MDKIIITNLSVRGIIGVHSDERQQPQGIVINVILFTNTKNAGQSDNIEDTVSYSAVAKKIRTHAENAQRFTVEALAEDIARICLEESRVQKVLVRVEKPRAIRFADSAGVEIERRK